MYVATLASSLPNTTYLGSMKISCLVVACAGTPEAYAVPCSAVFALSKMRRRSPVYKVQCQDIHCSLAMGFALNGIGKNPLWMLMLVKGQHS